MHMNEPQKGQTGADGGFGGILNRNFVYVGN